MVQSFGFLFSSFAEDQQSKEEEILEVDINEVVSNPKSFNGKRVYLEGIVQSVKYTSSSKGIPFTFFKLIDQDDNEVGVYYENGHLPISKGDKVRIMGKFKKEKRYFLYKFKNVIKARTVKEI